MLILRLLIILLVGFSTILHGSHFRGGTMTWRPWNNVPSGNAVTIQVRERWSWNRTFNSYYNCDDTKIAAHGNVGQTGSYYVTCVDGNCGNWTKMDTLVNCTDYSAALIVSSGEHYENQTFPLNTAFSIAFNASAWLNNLVVNGGQPWSVVCRIDTTIRPDGYINTSPIAVSLPIIYKQINIKQLHVVQMADYVDKTDILRCRWSSSSGNINNVNECSGACNGVPNVSYFNESTCTFEFKLTLAGVYAAVALQIEDFYSSSSTTPMSSVPIQFLFYGYTLSSTLNCTIPPAIIGNLPNRACIGVPIGSNVTEYIIVEIYCPGHAIVDLVSSVPTGMTKSTIIHSSPNIYEIILSWAPIEAQYGPQSLCAGAIDNIQLQSNQWCMTYLVGFESPAIIQPILVQGSASPIGTVFQNQTLFSIQTTMAVYRPTLNGTYIYFTDATANNTLVQKFDCGWDPNVIYTGYTTIIRFPVAPWIPGHFYYVTFDSGVASGTVYCGPESAPITDPTFWVFNIWDPALSSTTTTTTTPPTTHTVTSLGTTTTSINTACTTSGIVASTTAAVTTTTTITTGIATTAGPTTAGATTASGSGETTVPVMYPQDFINACAQPVAIMTMVIMAAMVPIQALVMYAAFTKFYNMFNPLDKRARLRHAQRLRNINITRR
ncbi:unnamed protein product [Adineta steineri]|uniref:Membrane-associated protein n=1 Tax=Adineta steineri TaxID=433720 RepID=A0A816E5Q4_9BILA|nr:unnamed protein product [Adineta steineri]CAF1492121.1 unnamed protein product [Adineta steineri]CAF1586949.1 unnamed protein product [Adineta steineri]CAF1641767.1 unnamed protein product [Adineta steineri]